MKNYSQEDVLKTEAVKITQKILLREPNAISALGSSAAFVIAALERQITRFFE